MVGRRRFWQLFLRQLSILLVVTLGLVAVLYFGNMMPYHSPTEWAEYTVFDLFVILSASALVARVKLAQEERRGRR